MILSLVLSIVTQFSVGFGAVEVPPGLGNDEAHFNHISEGADIYPYEWMMALKSIKYGDAFLNNLDDKFGVLDSRVQGDYLVPYDGITAAWSNHHPEESDAFKKDRDQKFREVHTDKGTVKSIKMVGTNCVICHTGEISYQGLRFRVDGAPNIVNIRGYFQDLSKSTMSLLVYKDRMTEFLKRLKVPNAEVEAANLNRYFHKNLGSETGWGIPVLSEKLGSKLTLFKAKRGDRGRLYNGQNVIAQTLEKLLRVTYGFKETDDIGELKKRMEFLGLLFVGTNPKNEETISGFGRTDAFGRIGNLVLRGPNPIDYTAPVSMPWIWGIKYMAMLHYTSNTNSVMLRNIGQSLGLGSVVLNKDTGESTSNLYNLNRLETMAHKIKVPIWNEVFQDKNERISPHLKVDETLANKGKLLYENRCAGCHTAEKVGPQKYLWNYKLFTLEKIGTDPMAARNVAAPIENKKFQDVIFDGVEKIKGHYYKKYKIPQSQIDEWEFRDIRGGEIFRDTKNGFTEEDLKKENLKLSKADGLENGDYKNDYTIVKSGYAYKAKNLSGVWSTAPYLHNGSVPTIWDLLSPASERPKYFNVKSREYDPKRLGYFSDRALVNGLPAPCAEKDEDVCFDTTIKGNSNTGHEFNPILTVGEKTAVIEYLKVLPPEPAYAW